MDGDPSRERANERPVGSDTIHAAIAHGNEYDDAVLPTLLQENWTSPANAGVRTETLRQARSAGQHFSCSGDGRP